MTRSPIPFGLTPSGILIRHSCVDQFLNLLFDKAIQLLYRDSSVSNRVSGTTRPAFSCIQVNAAAELTAALSTSTKRRYIQELFPVARMLINKSIASASS